MIYSNIWQVTHLYHTGLSHGPSIACAASAQEVQKALLLFWHPSGNSAYTSLR